MTAVFPPPLLQLRTKSRLQLLHFSASESRQISLQPHGPFKIPDHVTRPLLPREWVNLRGFWYPFESKLAEWEEYIGFDLAFYIATLLPTFISSLR